MTNYNKIYKNNKNIWGDKPNKSLLLVVKEGLVQNGNFLDLGCGLGRDSLFMARQGFNTIAVDSSSEGLDYIKKITTEENLKIKTVLSSISNFPIKKNYFSAINLSNVLHFLKKEAAIALLFDLKQALMSGGIIVIEGFTTEDDLYIRRPGAGFFTEDEIKNLFCDFKIIFYEEKIINDSGHAGDAESVRPHQHAKFSFVAQKIK